MRECEYYQELMSRLLDEELTAEEQRDLREHVSSCRECRQMFTAFTGMTDALREDLAEPPRDLARGVMERIADEKAEPDRPRQRRKSPGGRRPVSLWVRLGAAACLVLAVAGGAVAIRNGGTRQGVPESAEQNAAAPAAAPAGAEEETADVPDMISAQDGQAVYDAAGGSAKAAEEGAVQEAASTPEPEPLTVYDAARTRIGTIPPENIDAFTQLITDAGWGGDGPPDVQWEYLLKVEYQHKTYAFATDPGSGALVWWEEPSTDAVRSPGTLDDLHSLITTEAPALPE